MTRIVGGVAGGRLLEVPGGGTRPTSDRVREALFSTLDTLVDLTGARVLDLYAGSGAVGLEAASRGAAHVALVDSGREAGFALRRNAEVVGQPGIEIHRVSVESFLASASASASAGAANESASVAGYDVVFADPPYADSDDALAGVLTALVHPFDLLSPEAIVVVERAARTAAPSWPIVIQPIKNKRYGDTVLWYGRR
jgi:16S rRNA (guanine966-N2)-methyltransferase